MAVGCLGVLDGLTPSCLTLVWGIAVGGCYTTAASCAVEVQGRWPYQELPIAASSYVPKAPLCASSAALQEGCVSWHYPHFTKRGSTVAHGYLASNHGTGHGPE